MSRNNIWDASIKYLGYRARSVLEMKKYLEKKEYLSEDIEENINNLMEYGYLNDITYGVLFLEYSLNKRRGLIRIKRDLREKGINDVSVIIEKYEEDNKVDLKNIMENNALFESKKILKGLNKYEDKDFAKLGRRLNSLGYEHEIIYKIIGRYINE